MANLGANVGKTLAICALWVFVSGCASKLGYEVSGARTGATASPTSPTARLEGKVGTTDGAQLDLSQVSDLPTILVFSQDTCTVCGHEADTLRASLRDSTQSPSRIHLITVLVGAITEDAQDWKQAHRVPWTVATDTDASIFERYCALRTVPCNVVFMPGRGVVISQNGPMSPGELIAITGSWEN